jgi:ribosomal protein L19E
MTSRARIASNRSNGRKSRGPRTAAGKSSASLNALRHGLAAITHSDSALPPKIACIAKTLCGDDPNPLLLEQALIIAENEVMLQRVRAARVAAIEQRLQRNSAPMQARETTHDARQPEAIELKNELAAMRDAMPELDRLERFERRAWRHRKRAIGNFMEIKFRTG